MGERRTEYRVYAEITTRN